MKPESIKNIREKAGYKPWYADIMLQIEKIEKARGVPQVPDHLSGESMKKLLTATEAATFMRSSIHTIRAWTNQRKIAVVKAGRKCLYRQEDLEKFLEKGYRPAKD